MSRRIVCIIVGLLLLFVISCCSTSFSVIIGKETCMPVFAVTSGEEMVGVASTLCLKILPGSGRTYISTLPVAKEGVQAFAMIAVQVACSYALNVDCSKYDFLFRIESESPIIEGPSASAAMALLTFALLENLTIPKDVGITGMIMVDGTIAPVGGVYYKGEAAAKIGVKRFFIPFGNRYDKVVKKQTIKLPYGEISHVTEETVDVVKELKEKYGLEVIEVKTFDELIRNIFGSVSIVSYNETITEEYNEVFNTILKKSFNYLYNLLEEEEDKKELKDCPKKYDYYTCASLAFVKLKEERKRELENELSRESIYTIKAKILHLRRLLERNITRWWIKVEDLRKNIKNLISFEIFSILVDRIYNAEENLDKLDRYIELYDIDKIIDTLAFIEARLYSVASWYEAFKLANEINVSLYKFNISIDYIRNAVKNIINMVEVEVDYLSSVGLLSSSSEILNELERANQILYEGYPIVAFYEVREVEAELSTSINYLRIKPLSDFEKKKYVNEYIQSVENLLRNYEKVFLPFLSKCYLNYAKYYLSKGDYQTALFYAVYSSTLLSYYNNILFGKWVSPRKYKIIITQSKPTIQLDNLTLFIVIPLLMISLFILLLVRILSSY